MPIPPSDVFLATDMVGVIANALLGGAVARQLRLDPVGFLVLAISSALGGGILRDTMLQAGPPVAFTNMLYLGGAVLGAALAYLVPFRSRFSHRMLVVADALSLGCWSATGTLKALSVGLEVPAALLLGTITAIGGGMIRDVLVGRIPAVFGGNTLYATVAFTGSVEMALLQRLGQPTLGMTVAIVTCTTFALTARRLGWRLPTALEWDGRRARTRRGRV